MTTLDQEYIEYLNDNIKALNKELIDLVELPDAKRLRNRIKKEKKDTEAMVSLYAKINGCNEWIRACKVEIRSCIEKARELLGRGLQKAEKRPDNIFL